MSCQVKGCDRIAVWGVRHRGERCTLHHIKSDRRLITHICTICDKQPRTRGGLCEQCAKERAIKIRGTIVYPLNVNAANPHVASRVDATSIHVAPRVDAVPKSEHININKIQRPPPKRRGRRAPPSGVRMCEKCKKRIAIRSNAKGEANTVCAVCHVIETSVIDEYSTPRCVRCEEPNAFCFSPSGEPNKLCSRCYIEDATRGIE